MWSKDDHGFVHLGTFRAVRSTSGKVWILFTPSGKKKKTKNSARSAQNGMDEADGHWVQEKVLVDQFFPTAV